MSGKHDRPDLKRGAARRMAAAAARRRARRRKTVAAGVACLIAVAVVALLLRYDDKGTDLATSGSTTTSVGSDAEPAAGSAAGKPCVTVSDPLPEGAPEVPVKVGPPPTQLVSEDLVAGTGPSVEAGATVTVNYIGVSCSTGKVFDSSYSRGQPATFSLGGVIPGWQQGIPGMEVGGRRLLGIPPDQAYGSQGQGPSIAPNETLWFVVEVLDAKPA